MSCSTTTAPRPRGPLDRSRSGNQRRPRNPQLRQLDALGRPPASAAAICCATAGCRTIWVVPPDPVVDFQHAPRGAIRELKASVLVDDENAFDHAGEDGFHSCAVGLESAQTLRKVLSQPDPASRAIAPDLIVAIVRCLHARDPHSRSAARVPGWNRGVW